MINAHSSLPAVAATAPAGLQIAVCLDARVRDKADAIAQAARLLQDLGCVAPGYATGMQAREAQAETFLGHGVAIPHGRAEDRALVLRDAVAVLQVREGLDWNAGQNVHLVVAVAARSDAHITLLRRLAGLLQTPRLQALFTTGDAQQVIDVLQGQADPAPPAARPAAADLAEAREWTIAYPNGLHARPATRWAEAARGFASRIQVRHGDEVADARQMASLLQLGLREGDKVTVSAEGPDASAAVQRLCAVAQALVVQERADADAAARKAAESPVTGWLPPLARPVFVGLGASPGLAVARIHQWRVEAAEIPDLPEPLSVGGARLHAALAETQGQLRALHDDTRRRLGEGDAAIFSAQAEWLGDTGLITRACQFMVQGHGVAWAWDQAVEEGAVRLQVLDNPALAARAADLRDVGRRVLVQLQPSLAAAGPDGLPEGGCILVAADLSPSETAQLDTARVAALVTAQGSPTSHTAILARTLGLPAAVAAGGGVLGMADGALAIVDGANGRIYLDPSEQDLASARAHMAEQRALQERVAAQRSLPAITTDGVRIEVCANVNLPEQVPLALSQGAEGVGLMRTEFLFLERGSTPGEDEQYETYRAMAQALEGRPLIVRALDIGGDKQVAHLELPREDNPFLGVRGARLLLRRPDLLEPQMRALYRAARDGARLSVMFPMVTGAQELLALRAACERLRAELDAPVLPLGIMIEVPAAAVQADALARHADFFSIGTNDLTQYVLAMDRQNPQLAAEADSLHPAVLRMVRATVQGAATRARPVGVCGGLAGDPFGALLLAGLGVGELSMTPNDIAGVKAGLRAASLRQLQALADRALGCEDAAMVRELAKEVMA
ncbi:phosphoenolpyruvate--protein phosphotransferase [Delftia acidovorans]|uniref:phosphoenolpyruvate--protein phosphotransferase n=1 Tax=Delftia acidovorans TaxID=80866 RepID=UPI00333FBAB6